MRSTSFGLGVFSSVISVVLEVIAAIPVIGVVLSLVEGVVIGAAARILITVLMRSRLRCSVRLACLSWR